MFDPLMTERVLDLSDTAAYLRVQLDQLVIERKDEPKITVPLREAAVIVFAHPQVTCTHAVLSGIMEHGGSVVTCNRQSLPVGLMLPIIAHSTQGERFLLQAAASAPTCKRLWKQIVQAKVQAQARLLSDLWQDDHGFGQLAGRVRSGDPDNIEAQAARRYWPVLFDDPTFRRRREGEDQNRLLNYGYTVLRAIVARAICGAGLHPSLGLHHHNRYDPYCLAADLMEPYRPVVDAVVVHCVRTFGPDLPLKRQAKQVLLGGIMARYRCGGEVRTLFDLASRTASSLAKVFLKEADRLFIPAELSRAEG